jgi:hypothetical protein
MALGSSGVLVVPFALEAIGEGCSVKVAADNCDATFCEEAKDLTPPAFLGAMNAVEVAAQSAAATAYRAKIIVAILERVNYDYSKGLPTREKMLDTTRR